MGNIEESDARCRFLHRGDEKSPRHANTIVRALTPIGSIISAPLFEHVAYALAVEN